LTRWYLAAVCFKTALALRSNADAAAVALDDEMQRATPMPGLQRDLLATMSLRWLDAITIERGARRLAGWCNAELLRATGEAHLLKGNTRNEALAESTFLASLQCARDQQALAWELRSASSLARLWVSQGRRMDAERILLPVYEKFAEGTWTADLLSARAILEGRPTCVTS
jgi:predicted ATPase